MKKFFAALVLTIASAMFVFAATQKNDEVKLKAHNAISLATVSALSINGGVNKAVLFNKLKKKYPNSVIADSMIRMEVLTENGKSEYEFFHKILGTESRTERKLNEQDAFHATGLGFYLMNENIAVPGIGVLSTYPNPIQFADEAGALLNAHMEVFYNGYFQSKVGDTVYVPDLPLLGTRCVNTAQQTVLATNDSERRAGDGVIALTPNLHLKGRENNSLKVYIPGASTQLVQSVAGVYKAKLVLCLFGFKVTGAGNA